MASAALQIHRRAWTRRSGQPRAESLDENTPAKGPEPFTLIHSLRKPLPPERSGV
ncbi:hypothetical protein [Kitasatospora purpeofusca]|uniref:hypothetical protein n=1 Tax=Kitasatospora purpeofusca TaxID=67352 RepID=UPI00225A92CD|nr:hypothetical protein [Kitasatospora purpeofusca]MCX4757229.1 hypothetical protein [Kitasatospora purpeofusca]WSR35016.1 hypothetical protein OG715_31115 [Kitasatospora purpeofusca]WSR43346.1 hypothetical protein OG196_32205 [Kitasatospora purpeofusca]